MRYVQARKHGGTQSAVSRIVIHATVSPCVRGGARAVARYFQSAGAGGSAHYVVDPGEIVQCYPESTICWHAPPNTGSIGIELCDPQKGSAARWRGDGHREMLRLSAGLVRRVAARWDVPLRRLSPADLRAGRRGICGHADVSKAFGQTDHSDPGAAFPWDDFMAMVRDGAETTLTWTEKLMKDLPILREGSSGYDVKSVRALLVARGSRPEDLDLLEVKFTPGLAAAVKRFQQAQDLDPDGIVGPKTWAALLRLT